ncbi:MAG: hypothetical protein J1E16_10460 [Muribaculaceae bacterium]|nr:hypothetical protein [Muribaculaceae bacterium]
MAKPELISSLTILSKKIDNLLETQKKLQEKVNYLENINQALRNQHDEDVKIIEKAQKDIDYLSLSHRLADSPEALIEARNNVSKLIRTIDSCIRLIKED